MKESLKVKKMRKDAILPLRATSGSAGMDLYACLDSDTLIECGKTVLIPTGIAIALPNENYAAFIYARSGLAVKHGIAPANCVGVVDSDYRGEIMVGLANHSDSPYTVKPGERIAQLIIANVSTMPILEMENLDDTERGAGGFGSTG